MTSKDRSRVRSTSDHSNIVRMASSISISNWKSGSNLSNGVSIRVSLSLTLAKMSGISVVSIGNWSSISKVASIHSTITKSTNTTHQTMAIVNTSYNTSIGVSSCNLANGVGITVSIESSKRQDDKDNSSHDDDAGQSY